ncbi:TRAP transporter small permease [Vibrio sp. Isolate31]|uniref:TRAP transporter small permease n=1 Tax=unclassified Vibrio TaxID=2614977 RepID=UPI001EFDBB8A|nr:MULTISPECIES: TRAP transporter small permease [unclassified Vibrio]MCG9555291.1 TRAP transporter small permease [Vibrio sp. Isolate32]MCG9601529.1 TRAP transporter small permease [Vibrio sp. Isolate31]
MFNNVIENLENYICRFLLIAFTSILFMQIIARELFGHSISWSEESAVYLFVWFVFFGASRAIRIGAHNRIDFQYKYLPRKVVTSFKIGSELSWLVFNLYFFYLSYDFVFNKMNLYWKSQTIGIPMKVIYVIMPIAFFLMTLRHIQVNVKKIMAPTAVNSEVESEQIKEIV